MSRVLIHCSPILTAQLIDTRSHQEISLVSLRPPEITFGCLVRVILATIALLMNTHPNIFEHITDGAPSMYMPKILSRRAKLYALSDDMLH